MSHGYSGRILRVDLSGGRVSIDEPQEAFYRSFLGGRGFISYFLLHELGKGVDALGPANKLVFAPGVVTGSPIGGSGRNSVGAKSPLTNAYGDSEAGGYFGAELKHAGYDALIIEGQAEKPAYLWIKNENVEIRDASHLWGKTIAESQNLLQQELGDNSIRTAQIGPAGENLVRYACILNDVSHAAGRTGMGAVMGSKRLKAVAVRGHRPPSIADPPALNTLAKFIRDNVSTLSGALNVQGTASNVRGLNRLGTLPTRNFQQGTFAGADNISGRVMTDTILVGRGTCYACPVYCKRKVATKEPYVVDPTYGGPEYETLAALGSNCGIDNLVAISKANELCNAYGLDTISAGATIAFAMECCERGLLGKELSGETSPRFGDASAMVNLVGMIARREGLGDFLAEGVARCSRRLGQGAEEIALHVKGQEVPMHEPRGKNALGLGYAISPTGADHCHNMHDNMFAAPGMQLDELKALGIMAPLPFNDLSAAKVRMFSYYTLWRHLNNCLVYCIHMPLDHTQVTEMVRAVTGWNTTTWELMKVAERCLTLARLFNIREGLGAEDDYLPKRFFTPFTDGPLAGVGVDSKAFEQAKKTFYLMMGWDAQGKPTMGKLQELGNEDIGVRLGLR